jgi:hypothetical protein
MYKVLEKCAASIFRLVRVSVRKMVYNSNINRSGLLISLFDLLSTIPRNKWRICDIVGAIFFISGWQKSVSCVEVLYLKMEGADFSKTLVRKGNVVLVHAMKAYSESGAIFNTCTRWGEWLASSSRRFTPGKTTSFTHSAKRCVGP